jgi:Zn-dependent peptidase ImmA (M78 family)
MGLRVAYRNLGRHSGYLFGGGLVILNHRHHLGAQRVTLAHEMGHWHLGHDWTREHSKMRDEREADQYAARLLITAEAYACAERECGTHPGAIARELGVTRRLVELRREDFARDVRILETVEQWRRDTWAS